MIVVVIDGGGGKSIGSTHEAELKTMARDFRRRKDHR